MPAAIQECAPIEEAFSVTRLDKGKRRAMDGEEKSCAQEVSTTPELTDGQSADSLSLQAPSPLAGIK